MILRLVKKLIPKKFHPGYHKFLARFGAFIYGYPSNKMIVIGVTGTSGKSSTCYFIAQALEKAGLKVGMTSTTLFKIGDKEWLNDKKMTMLGRFQTHKLLSQMKKAGCEVVVIESSSQGVEQFRYIGINYDVLVFTNLYPEHIEAHGGFENYKAAKGKLFQHLSSCKDKNLKTKVSKTIISNLDDEHSEYFLNFKAEKKIGFTREGKTKEGLDVIQDKDLNITLLGDYNRYNVLAASSVLKSLGQEEQKDYSYLKPLPGRLEFIENNRGIQIIVDYAFEPKAVEKLYATAKEGLKYNRIIHVLGSAGGGRDKARRPILGRLAAQNADIVIITNEDPYDENPRSIIDDIYFPAKEVSGNKSVLKITDRRDAFKKALDLAKEGDLLLVTGKGAEQAICGPKGKLISWDDRQEIRELL